MNLRFIQRSLTTITSLFFFCASLLTHQSLYGNPPLKSQNEAERLENTPSTSVLANGPWLKIGVTKPGIYKISYDYLKSVGFSSEISNPQTIKLYGNGGGMLPEPNAVSRPFDLTENAIQVIGEEDGRLDNGDYILFYATGPDKVFYNDALQRFEHEKNLYSDTCFYFLTVSTEKGKRIQQENYLNRSLPEINSFNNFYYFEEETYNIISHGSGRQWFGEKFISPTTKSYNLPIQDVVENTEIKIKGSFLGTSTSNSSFSVKINEVDAFSVSLPYIIKDQYAEKGKLRTGDATINSSALTSRDKLQLNLNYQGNSAHLNYFEVEAVSQLQYTNQAFLFRSVQSLLYPEVTYAINSSATNLKVWDITSKLSPQQIALTFENGKAAFSKASTELKSFIAFTDTDILTPISAKVIANQNLKGDLSPELVIIVHPKVLSQAERLADFRRTFDGLATKVVTIDQVYNEFSSGAQDVVAIRDYMRYLFTNGGKLKYLLLFGRGYYDFKNRTERAYNLIPLYQSYNSTHPIESYSSDDFYGFLNDNEGNWIESEEGNQFLDIGIGRLPVIDLTEAKVVVDKLIHYASNAAAKGAWRNSICFVADDGDNNAHQKDAEALATTVEQNYKLFDLQKIYIGAFEQKKLPNGESVPAATAALTKAIDRGALIVNYTGHGSREKWAEESILTKSIIDSWTNYDKLPLFVTATCEFGQHDGKVRSGAEHLLFNAKGGAIGLLTTARPVYSHTNFKLNSSFYNNFYQTNHAELRLGDLAMLTKNNSIQGTGVINRNFILLGDPSMRLSYPTNKVAVKGIFKEGISAVGDTIRAYDKVLVIGEIENSNGDVLPSFNGIVTATIFDKPVIRETFAEADSKNVMEFSVQDNALFRGQATIKEGVFKFEFYVPKNINYQVGLGKISLYAVNKEKTDDAVGAYYNFFIGQSSLPIIDDLPPKISLYLNDSTFRSGNKTKKDATLLAYLEDDFGLNISSVGVDQTMILTLDDSISYLVNDYFLADLDDYRKGSFIFPLRNLPAGKHTISLKARDIFNNSSEASLDFIVSDHPGIQIFSQINAPNPVKNHTTFHIQHNRAGEDLETNVYIYGLNGQLLSEIKTIHSGSLGTIKINWETENRNFSKGLYFYKVVLRSLFDNSVTERTEKLVILD